MRLIGLAVILALSFTREPLVSDAQQAGKVRELNYVEGQNLVVRLAFAVGRPGDRVIRHAPCPVVTVHEPS